MSRSYDKCTMLEICPECEDLFIDINKPTALHVSIDLEGELIVTIDICGTFPMSLEAKEFNDKLYNTFKYVREENGDFVFMQFVKSLSFINSNLDVYYINLSKHAILKDIDDSNLTRNLKELYMDVFVKGEGNYFTRTNREMLFNSLKDLNFNLHIDVHLSIDGVEKVKVINSNSMKALEHMLYLELCYINLISNDLLDEYLRSLDNTFSRLYISIFRDNKNLKVPISLYFTKKRISKEEAVEHILELDKNSSPNSEILIKDPRALVYYYNLSNNKSIGINLLNKFKNSAVVLKLSDIDVSKNSELEEVFIPLIEDERFKLIVDKLNNNLNNIKIIVASVDSILTEHSDKLLYCNDCVEGILDWYKDIVDTCWVL